MSFYETNAQTHLHARYASQGEHQHFQKAGMIEPDIWMSVIKDVFHDSAETERLTPENRSDPKDTEYRDLCIFRKGESPSPCSNHKKEDD